MIVAFVITLTPTLGVTGLFDIGDFFASPEARDAIGSQERWIRKAVIDLVLQPLTAPVMMGSIIVLFHDRRVRTEALDLETRAASLDASR